MSREPQGARVSDRPTGQGPKEEFASRTAKYPTVNRVTTMLLRRTALPTVLLAALLLLALPPAPADAQALPGAPCTNGFAGPFPCENVDLLSQVPIPLIGAATGADVWGWTDPETGREIAIPTTTFGMAYVDVTDPAAPVVLGRTYVGYEGSDDDTLWRDVKVVGNHAFLVSEHVDTNLTVLDLTTLRDVTSDQGLIDPTYVYEAITDAHNIAVNEDTEVVYPVAGGECAGGMSMLDVSDPAAITDLGCVNDETLGVEEGTFGVVHDAQCIVYLGEDVRFQGREICFTSNEERGMFIVDVTDRDAPKILANRTYDAISYAHQGWVTEDHQWFIFGDELDELTGGQINTRSLVVNIEDLMDPGDVQIYTHDTTAIDHNLYVEDGYVWQANYSAGLRIFDYTDEGLASGELEPVAFFDVDPGEDAPVFAGAWSPYPFFDSGTVVVNSFDSGMFVLAVNLPEKTVEQPPAAPSDDDGSGGSGGQAPSDDDGSDGGSGDPSPASSPSPSPAPATSASPAANAAGTTGSTGSLPSTGGGMAVAVAAVALAAAGRRRSRR